MKKYLGKIADAVAQSLARQRATHHGKVNFVETIWEYLGDYEGDKANAFKIIQRNLSMRGVEKRNHTKKYFEDIADAVEHSLATQQARTGRASFEATVQTELRDYTGDQEKAAKIVRRILFARNAEKQRRARREQRAAAKTTELTREIQFATQQFQQPREPEQLNLFEL